MDRYEFRKIFKIAGPVVLPVIPVLTREQTERNVLVAVREHVPGVLLINHDFPYDQFLPIITAIRSKFPALWFGVNFFGAAETTAFPVLGKLHEQGVVVDAYWADSGSEQKSSQEILEARQKSSWKGVYFGGAVLKMQAAAVGLGKAATAFIDVVTTSTHATAKASPIDKVKAIRKGCGKFALALVSDIAPAEAANYTHDVDCFIVAAGISKPGDLHNLDPLRLRALMHAVQQRSSASTEVTPATDEKWYLNLIAPNTKGPNFVWLDPSSIYLNGEAFRELTEDILRPFNQDEIDLVAGIDGMGFPMAAMVATKLGKGFLAIRKGDHLPVDVDQESYSGEKKMELRKNAFLPKTRVLLVDQYALGGHMVRAAITLIERQQGILVGVAAIGMERNTSITAEIRKKYKCSFAIPESIQTKFDKHTFFDTL